jgi:hypothetical protein
VAMAAPESEGADGGSERDESVMVLPPYTE